MTRLEVKLTAVEIGAVAQPNYEKCPDLTVNQITESMEEFIDHWRSHSQIKIECNDDKVKKYLVNYAGSALYIPPVQFRPLEWSDLENLGKVDFRDVETRVKLKLDINDWDEERVILMSDDKIYVISVDRTDFESGRFTFYKVEW